jgi:hypothetical protein
MTSALIGLMFIGGMTLFIGAVAGLVMDAPPHWGSTWRRYRDRTARELALREAMYRLYAGYYAARRQLWAEANRRAWEAGEDEP